MFNGTYVYYRQTHIAEKCLAHFPLQGVLQKSISNVEGQCQTFSFNKNYQIYIYIYIYIYIFNISMSVILVITSVF